MSDRHVALVIDDEPDIRELLEITLNRMQVETTVLLLDQDSQIEQALPRPGKRPHPAAQRLSAGRRRLRLSIHLEEHRLPAGSVGPIPQHARRAGAEPR